MTDEEIISRIATFLEETGIPLSFATLEEDTFLPGITIRNGGIVADRQRLLYPGDLLHEAGHIAVVAPHLRPELNDNVISSPDHNDGNEIAAILWSYAALKHIGLPEETVFHPHGYKGDSRWYIDNFRNGTYIGLPLLQWMGMTTDTAQAALKGTEPFPKMICWLRSSGGA